MVKQSIDAYRHFIFECDFTVFENVSVYKKDEWCFIALVYYYDKYTIPFFLLNVINKYNYDL